MYIRSKEKLVKVLKSIRTIYIDEEGREILQEWVFK